VAPPPHNRRRVTIQRRLIDTNVCQNFPTQAAQSSDCVALADAFLDHGQAGGKPGQEFSIGKLDAMLSVDAVRITMESHGDYSPCCAGISLAFACAT
jgi:hypothetical protein